MRPIDADALNARFEELKGHPKNTLADVIFLDGAMSVVDVAPTLDYAPVVHGAWVKQKNGRLICKLCGVRGLQDSDELDYYYYPSVYCPNCGARMDGKEDGNDAVHT